MQVKPIIIITVAACSLMSTGCMMPNREAQTAHNEERIAAEGITKLENGVSAPALATAGTAGEFDLTTTLAQGRVVLFFFPATDTPNSTKELLQYSQSASELAAQQITVYGITGAADAQLSEYATKYGITVPLLADPQLSAALAYGCALPGGTYPQRTTIGVNTDGSIAFYQRNQLTTKEILAGFGIE